MMTDGKLVGEPGSPGITEGVACFVDYKEAMRAPQDVPDGAILVTHIAHSCLTPELQKAKGIVALGSSLGAHLIKICREQDKPAVIGLEDGTFNIESLDGERVRVDGDSGRVEVLTEVES